MGLKNAQFDELMRIYERRRFAHLHELDERTGEIAQKVPAMTALENEIHTASADRAECMIRGDYAAAAELKTRVEALRRKKEQVLVAAGYPADYLAMRYTCPDCRDTGYIGDEKCRCLKQAAIDLLYAQSGIREVVEKENFDLLSMDYYSRDERDPKSGLSVYEHMDRVIAQLKAYVDRFSAEKGSLLFTGSTGSGKTYLSHCIAKELMDRGFSVVYLTAAKIFDIFSKQTFSRDEIPEYDVDQYILDCDLLIIDDLGTEFANQFTVTKLFYCINERYSRGKGTLISTNLAIRDLADLYSERISSRIISYYQVIPFFGEDIRIQKKLNERTGRN